MAIQQQFEKDVIPTIVGDLEITFLGHGSLMLALKEQVIYVDPFGQVADYAQLPPADLILITHEHPDHLDLRALASIRREKTTVVLTKTCAEQVKGGIVMQNGDTRTVNGLRIEAVPAYNLIHKRENGQWLHYHLWRPAALYRRRHREHPRNEEITQHRLRLFAYERPLHDDPGDGGRCCPGIPAQYSVSLSLRKH